MTTTLDQRRAALVARLDHGDDLIAAHERRGEPVPDHWVEAWLALLSEYMACVNEQRAQERGAAARREGRA